MDSKVRISRLAILSFLASIAGCAALPVAESPGVNSSDHTIQELCDFAEPFFSGHFNMADFETTNLLSMAKDRPIDVGNVCVFDTPAGAEYEHLGRVALWQDKDTV